MPDFRPADFVLDFDPLSGITETMRIDDKGMVQFNQTQDVTALLKEAHEARGERAKHERIGEWRRVATLPMIIRAQLEARGIMKDQNLLKKWLSSEEGRPWRTDNMRLA
jgi:hypothetical protein